MNNYYTLIYLIKEWKPKLINTVFSEAVSSKRNLIEIYFSGLNEDFKLVFSTSGQRCAIFIDKYRKPSQLNSAGFFEELGGNRLVDIELADADRYLTFWFEDRSRLVFLLYSNNANVFYENNGKIIESFKKEKDWKGEDLPIPKPVAGSGKSGYAQSMNDLIGQVDPLLPRGIIKWYYSELFSNGRVDEVKKGLILYSESLKKRIKPHFHPEYGFGLLPIGLINDEQIRKFELVNDAVAYSFYQGVRFHEFELKKRDLLTRIERAGAKLEKSQNELEQSKNSLQKADAYEKIAHLLMASPSKTYPSKKITMPDFFDASQLIEIEVDSERDHIYNAQKYYQRAKNARKSYENAIKRKSEIDERLNQINKLWVSLTKIDYLKDLEKWIKSNAQLLQRIGFLQPGSDQPVQGFRQYELSGYRLRVGKSALGNDELLRISHKEDIWLHARGVSGSHVVIPMNRNQDFPPKNILESAAEVAAFFSKSKGSSLVPVIFTKRKYVRKSKGMDPGAVFVDKEQVILVQPSAPDKIVDE